MSARAVAPASAPAVDELERGAASAAAEAIVYWRGEPIGLPDVPERIARISLRAGRELLYASWVDAVEALNPLHAARLAAWKEAGLTTGQPPAELRPALRRLVVETENPYHAALRRGLALIGIEQGDASEADLWYVLRGGSWLHWFGRQEVTRALAATGLPTDTDDGGLEGWRAAEHRLAAGVEADDSTVAAALAAVHAGLIGSPEWLAGELGVDPDGVGEFTDFAAFVRLWRLRRQLAMLTYQQRLFDTDDVALQRAYYAGIVGHQTGVALAEAGYLAAVEGPGRPEAEIRGVLLAAMAVDALERAHGAAWWRADGSRRLLERASTMSAGDAIALFGYDGWDPGPVLRQLRTRLIGEMSGYGGPNITTRAGTRKV